jgi:integrase
VANERGRARGDRVPSYRRHKASGQAVVTLGGKDHYLGVFDSPESRAEYDRVVGEWLTVRRAPPADPRDGVTVEQVMLPYWKYVQEYYRKEGQPTTEQHCIKAALRVVRRLYGTTKAKDFGPVALTNVRAAMVAKGWVRTTVNHQVGRVKRMFKWATANELVPPGVYHGLLAIDGLRHGRTPAPDPDPVRPVNDLAVEKTLQHVSSEVAAMVRLQRLTGMRPGEVVILRPCDLKMSGEVWSYTPMCHKTEHHGRSREIALGPKAQEVLRPFLGSDLIAFVFSPKHAETLRRAECRRKRKSPMTPSQRIRKPKTNPKCAPRDRYDVASYRRAIDRASERAGVASWSPNQLRHTLATEIRRRFGLDAARAILGHSSVTTTEIYAEFDAGKAQEVMRQVG